MRSQYESNLTILGADPALEVVAVALVKTFPLPQSKPDEQMDRLLHALANLEDR
ncbi:MAG: hypothetical protein ABW034_04180 [Steroidobacteraceae bacterium]